MKLIKIITTAAFTACMFVSAQAEEMVDMELELPKPRFEGTPVPVKLPHLKKPLGHARPAFKVPAGTKNILLGKEVISSDMEPVIGELELITDGDKEATDGSYVELGPFVQWVQFDLGAPHTMYAIVMWHYHMQARVYHDVIIQTSDDKDFVEGVKTIFNNDHDNSAGLGAGKDLAFVEVNEGELIDLKGAKGRYVRLYSNGNTANEMNHYTEVEIHGKPAK
jgi:hypothetical protein